MLPLFFCEEPFMSELLKLDLLSTDDESIKNKIYSIVTVHNKLYK